MQSKTQLNVFRLVKRLEEKNNVAYSNTAIAQKSGLSRVTVNGLVSSGTQRIDLETIDKLLDFFATEGMPVSPCDIFVVNT